MNGELIGSLGDELYEALKACRTLEPLTHRHTDIGIDDAYAIQQRMMKRRFDAGERVVGKKIGVTSAAVMNMLGVYQPDFGWLTDAMLYNEGEAIEAKTLIQPKAEGEIAFVLKKTLKGPGVGVADVLAATEGVMTCFEIVDSRIRDWKIKIQATGAGAAALGHPANAVAWLANTLGARGIALEAGEVVLSGSLAIMVPVSAGDNLRVTIGGIGGCSVRFV